MNIIIKAIFCSVRFSIFKVCNNECGAILIPPVQGVMRGISAGTYF